MTDLLTPIIRAVRKQMGPAIPAVCSAHPDVIAAALRQARDHAMPALIQIGPQQVNQFGGHSDMTPADFARLVRGIADDHDLSGVPLILGGDGLGPLPWRAMPADAAMGHAAQMVADYVAAGFTKLHLDCSQGCAGEADRLPADLAAARAATLAVVAEARAPDPEALTYVIGSDSGPATLDETAQDETAHDPTTPQDAAAMLAAHEAAFAAAGTAKAWRRVRALAIQPGLGFGPTTVQGFDMGQPDRLSAVLGDQDRLGFEVGPVDYQPARVCADLTRRNAAVLKLGASLSFAWREALYALSHIRSWLDGSPHISDRIEALMLEHPQPWQDRYHGPAQTQRLLRHFSHADHVGHYWPRARAEVQALCDALDATGVPQTLLLQYLPPGTLQRAARIDLPPAHAILQAHVEEQLAACYPEETC